MLAFWTWLRDPANQQTLGWIGGGVVVVVGGVWAGFKFFFSKQEPKAPSPPTVSATGGGVAAGRDIRDSKIDTRRSGSKR